MGSEMCIRDRPAGVAVHPHRHRVAADARLRARAVGNDRRGVVRTCLLYTSDAADERSSVDLGGRRIIKKKNNVCVSVYTADESSRNYASSTQ